MKLEVGQFVRTPYGIDKIKDVVLNGNLYEDSGLYLEKNGKMICGKEEMKNLKASHNIIDLIEVGDIIEFKELRTHLTNESGTKFYGKYVISIFDDKELEVAKEEIEGKHMKLLSIVTKEQFEEIAYKIMN